jgi:hypothetical protein
MSYFGNATLSIAEVGGHGDHKLSGDEFNSDDRRKRIEAAASSLCDWVSEYLIEHNGDAPYGLGIFKQEHLPTIARMVAIGMMAQHDFDPKMEGELVTAFAND